jgi:hypothetical protein
MASTYSPSLGIELIGQGEQSGTWGITTNNNLGTLLEQAITGVQTISMSNATYTLSVYQGASDEARNAVLQLVGTNTVPQNLIAPGVNKVYVVKNNSGANVTIKTSGGNGVNIINGTTTQVYCDGTNFYSAASSGNSVIGDLAVTGNVSAGGNIVAVNETLTGNLTVGGTLTASSITGVTGRIVQYVQSVSTTQVGYSGGADYATGHTATITPTSTSSKILVMLTAGLAQTNFGFGLNAYLTMVRNGTNLTGGYPWDFSVNCQSGVNSNIYGSAGFQFLDYPSSTSALTYQPYINTNGYVVYNNQQRAILTLLEIL